MNLNQDVSSMNERCVRMFIGMNRERCLDVLVCCFDQFYTIDGSMSITYGLFVSTDIERQVMSTLSRVSFTYLSKQGHDSFYHRAQPSTRDKSFVQTIRKAMLSIRLFLSCLMLLNVFIACCPLKSKLFTVAFST
jgi:hypothetical protein